MRSYILLAAFFLTSSLLCGADEQKIKMNYSAFFPPESVAGEIQSFSIKIGTETAALTISKIGSPPISLTLPVITNRSNDLLKASGVAGVGKFTLRRLEYSSSVTSEVFLSDTQEGALELTFLDGNANPAVRPLLESCRLAVFSSVEIPAELADTLKQALRK